MLAAGGGLIFRERVSVGRYRSTSGVNLEPCECESESESVRVCSPQSRPVRWRSRPLLEARHGAREFILSGTSTPQNVPLLL